MKLKEFSTKYGFDYHIAYRSMTESGDIITHTHDEEYEEETIYNAVLEYFTRREKNFEKRRLYYDDKIRILKEKHLEKGTKE